MFKTVPGETKVGWLDLTKGWKLLSYLTNDIINSLD